MPVSLSQMATPPSASAPSDWTSAVKFMVALDTESDLFWVPCDCTRCAATDSPTFASYFPNCRYQHTMTIKLLKLGKIDVYM
ncbi:uncharacterized protein LOC111242033 isoform X5 [Vigna radiata var. radiata]|uniref:Uncharacterized protein LOC111242033 isoform X5 n=1 Tax=Vigna radiata var. radiata TaxID=3916 RepID=A0A3Q0F4H0_VIGRR|nr:uncharacterized protein LOC111242033 isoform X5 [Vigna radiata var. radiata]